MRRPLWLFRYIDPFLVAILTTVAIASFAPAHGEGAVLADAATNAAVALLFFLHGAKLSPSAALAGARHWRLHGLVFSSTFILFPLVGLAAHALMPQLLPASLWGGVLLVTILPSTVQASIAFTSVAGGNVPAAICSASASNLMGLVLTPLLAGFVLSQRGVGLSGDTVVNILLQMLAPFVAGQLLRPWIGSLVSRNARLLKFVDYGSILLIVYAAFSHGMVNGLWHQVDAAELLRLALVDVALLAIIMALLTIASRRLGFSRPDEITIVFCGSKKSLATGLPIANVLFAGHVGLAILPVMLFHQIQLMVCATLAKRYAARRSMAVLETATAAS
ncbi:solute carrier family 10 (sodium/bile acid cotransporter), member 7 [Enhydrobacter aerosaccus]|uniref:Solute carrier family 10 (Sodium/bile acid cotransporter), member 7 n=1 Tax=Enhydrobacter aerosaccus TaxID=225324 RepID=A0A1T4NSH8_9HYPH|nr:bile acid:sodium symporter family protein [Enhydrobacter aerosaccus]SJZ82211.1 solute carrier family 10 (sodium/bile acid cotransporter), member 7 [Enhydrobacter aerosaccus]